MLCNHDDKDDMARQDIYFQQVKHILQSASLLNVWCGNVQQDSYTPPVLQHQDDGWAVLYCFITSRPSYPPNLIMLQYMPQSPHLKWAITTTKNPTRLYRSWRLWGVIKKIAEKAWQLTHLGGLGRRHLFTFRYQLFLPRWCDVQ